MDRTKDALRWFKQTFGPAVATAVAGTPFTVDFFAALAFQESYDVWGGLYQRQDMTTDRILELCVGDTLDAPRRGAGIFPTNKADLLTDPNGAALFAVARGALEDVGQYVAIFHKIAVANPDKFFHAFGIFQYDIQFALDDPAFFLERKWRSFDACLAKALGEMTAALKRAYGPNKTSLTDKEMAYVAIAYNKGSVNTAGSLKQGFKDDSGLFYGEAFFNYLTIAHGV